MKAMHAHITQSSSRHIRYEYGLCIGTLDELESWEGMPATNKRASDAAQSEATAERNSGRQSKI